MFEQFKRLTEETKFYFVRHGETEGNRAGIVQGIAENPLSELGRAHAEAAARWLAGRGISYCSSSPLARARDTAATITATLAIGNPDTDENLIEIDTGIFTNLTFAQIAEQYPEHYRRFQVESWEAVPKAERTDSLYRRAAAVWSRLIDVAEQGHRNILCVTHSGTLQWIVKATIGYTDQPWMPLFRMDNCGISLFEARPAYYEPPVTGPGSRLGRRSKRESSVDHSADGFFGQWRLINHLPYDQ